MLCAARFTAAALCGARCAAAAGRWPLRRARAPHALRGVVYSRHTYGTLVGPLGALLSLSFLFMVVKIEFCVVSV
jgi:hypothetical protein